MSKWLIAMLDSSKYTGGRLVSRQTYEELFRPQTIVPSVEYPTFSILKPQWITYGLGWYQHDYKGKKVNFHTGSLPGLTAIIGLILKKRSVYTSLETTIMRKCDMRFCIRLLIGLRWAEAATGTGNSKFSIHRERKTMRTKFKPSRSNVFRILNPTFPLERVFGQIFK
jgi:hypothetical protein